MAERKWEPWKWYPRIWKTEASFWSYLRGAFRRGIWEKSPAKLDFKNKVVDLPPKGYNGRAKTGQYCALTGEWVGKSKGEIDHKIGHRSLLKEDDILDFVKHLVPHPDDMQFVDKEAHKIKSFSERRGISFEQAKAEKAVIQIIKDKQDKLFLEVNNIKPASNAKGRREQLIKLLESGNYESPTSDLLE